MLTPWTDAYFSIHPVFFLQVAETAYKGDQLLCSQTGKILVMNSVLAGRGWTLKTMSMLNVSGWPVLMITSVAWMLYSTESICCFLYCRPALNSDRLPTRNGTNPAFYCLKAAGAAEQRQGLWTTVGQVSYCKREFLKPVGNISRSGLSGSAVWSREEPWSDRHDPGSFWKLAQTFTIII